MSELIDLADPFRGSDVAQLPTPSPLTASWASPNPAIGNTHPGPCHPFGMVSVAPFTGGYPSGYGPYAPGTGSSPVAELPAGTTTGFTHFHQSGTGRIGSYYNHLRVAPERRGVAHSGRRLTLADEEASPGRYRCRLVEADVTAELTVGPRAAFHRYTFPSGVGASVAIDLSAAGLAVEGLGEDVVAADAELLDDHHARGRIAAGGPPVHFFVECRSSGPVRSELWRADGVAPFGRGLRLAPGDPALGRSFGVRFLAEHADTASIEVRIGFSLRSADRAERNLAASSGRSFEALADDATRAWRHHLDAVRVDGGTARAQELLASALYRSFVKPCDCTGENPFAGDDGPVYFDLATLWSSYRTQLPLILSLFPERGTDLVTALLAVAEREGEFPISYLFDNRPERFGRQASTLAHVTIADALVRDLPGIDPERCLRLMAKSLRQGRAAELDVDRPVHPLSHTLDLAQAHRVTARLAEHLGDEELAAASARLAGSWAAAFEPDTGLLAPSEYFGGERWNYSFRLSPGLGERVEAVGGARRFATLLDRFFGFADRADTSISRFSGLNHHADLDAPYAYLWCGRHDRTAEIVRACLAERCAPGRGGMAGLDHSGALSSWVVWSSLGLFPVAGEDLLLVGSPSFDEAEIRLGDAELRIEAPGATDAPHVSSITLDGRPLDGPFLRWSDVAGGGTLRVEMSAEATGFGRRTTPDHLPPSAHDASGRALAAISKGTP
ncbi:MAG: glycoside hydrolase family 92 protein [Actinomycetota bacterium]|nr:glycoside hydrolase family 92 protein [Actinomycetota bacterium]